MDEPEFDADKIMRVRDSLRGQTLTVKRRFTGSQAPFSSQAPLSAEEAPALGGEL
jgi:hypothetical protein